ncbi:MAG: heme-binding protein [Betaproteobacteria bacterium]|nr:heme-binding protein [Betaproteobacteria bacterium]
MNFAFTLALAAALAAPPVMARIEEPAFDTEKSSGDFEVRRYAPRIVAQAEVEGDLWGASNDGFRVIAGYIFGNNVAVTGGGAEKIAMTAPVTTEPIAGKIAMTAPVTMERTGDAAGGRYRMHFVMPAQYTMATLPRPKDERVKLLELPPQRMAVVKFSGLSGEGKVKEKTDELLAWVKTEGLEAAGPVQLARYDPPWTLPFLRRNEVMVPLR